MTVRRTTNQGLSFLDVTTPLCTASLCLQGAHLTSWKPAGHEECLFLSPNAAFVPGKAIRGGIPVCWPWFGPREGAPSHGIARTSEWRLHHQEMDKCGNVLLSLAFYPEDESYPAAILRLTLGCTLTMKLETTARTQPCKLTEAFHNYFAVGNLTKCRVHGLEDIPFREEAAQPMKHGEHPLAPLGCLDRVYNLPSCSGKTMLEDLMLNRTITVERNHASSVIVWNPGQQDAKNMADLGAESWNKFLCIETGNAEPRSISLAPGQTHTLYQKISVRHMEEACSPR